MESWADMVEAEERWQEYRQNIRDVVNRKKAREIMKGRPEWASSKIKQERKYWSDMEKNRIEINKLIDEIEKQKATESASARNLNADEVDQLKAVLSKMGIYKKEKEKDDLVRNAKKNKKRFIAFLRKEKKHSIGRDPARHTVKLLQKYKNQKKGGRKRRKSRKRRRKTRKHRKTRKR